MIKSYTVCKVADNSGAKSVRVIHPMIKRSKFGGKIGDVVVASVRDATPQGQVKKKQIVKAVIARTKAPYKRKDGSVIRFDDNAVIILENDRLPKGTRVIGPIAKELKELGYQKIVSLAQEVL